MNSSRSVWSKAAAVAGLGLALLGGASVAHARDVYWSVGIDAAPGVSVGVANHRQVVVQPAPVYVQPAPIYVQPAPVYVQPQVVYSQPRVMYAPPVYYAAPAPVYHGPPGHWKHKHKGKHWKKHHGWDD